MRPGLSAASMTGQSKLTVDTWIYCGKDFQTRFEINCSDDRAGGADGVMEYGGDAGADAVTAAVIGAVRVARGRVG
jgi:hypothetical protein